jgi:hypothetical protein
MRWTTTLCSQSKRESVQSADPRGSLLPLRASLLAVCTAITTEPVCSGEDFSVTVVMQDCVRT